MVRKASVIFFVLQLMLTPLQLAEAQEASPEDEVRRAIVAFSRAFVEADVTYLRSHLTQEYIHINGSSGNVLNRVEWLDWVNSRRAALAGGALVISDYSVADIVVKIYGTTAVVTGIVESSGMRKGVPITSRIRFTNVWVKQGGTWLRAAFHDSAIPRPTP